jgi:putative transposase
MKTAHATSNLEYHFVFTTKYRRPALVGEVGQAARQAIRAACTPDITILSGSVSKEHVHLLVAAHPKLAPSEIARLLKGRSAHELFQKYPQLRKDFFWGGHLWGIGYFVSSAGEIGREQVKKYISHHFRKDLKL